MPTIILARGWRLFFYSDERNEPMHVHARKAEAECKFWLVADTYEIEEEWSFNLSPRLRRVRKLIFDHFDLIVEEWNGRFRGHRESRN